MRSIVQRVSLASVSIDGRIVGQIGVGLCLLLGIHRDDDQARVRKMADKIVNLRIFSDADGKMNLSLVDLRAAGVDCAVLAISNFTVYGDTAKNRRPSFIESAPYDVGERLFALFLSELRATGFPVATGEFGADMQVTIVNDGPVTVVVDV